ncbi:MAG: tetraacyldisaccharide 4'-kinase [Pyrinomonadaceae bacterium]|nr:tetraacyldisaccharide 4'-kinase [Pyrinomonadaceae bacterium]
MKDNLSDMNSRSFMTAPSHFTPALMPLSLLYNAVTRARTALYRKGLIASYELGAPVISVGNITTGGTGKTPVVAWIADDLAREGLRVCILTRGYGRKREGKRVLVSDGERILADAEDGGDEPRLLAEMLQGKAAVLSDRDRVAAALWARENLGSEAFILDDGFQHLRVRREMDIVTLDATNPFGGGRLLPQGRLREPPASLKRADLIIITRSEQVADANSLKREVERLSGRKNALISRTRTGAVRSLVNLPQGALSSPSSYRVAAFCALGNPQSFFKHLERTGFDLTHTRAFADHHAYTQSDVDEVAREAIERGAEALLTSAKDAVKLRSLRFELPCFVVEIEFAFENETTLRDMIRQAIGK